MRRPPPPTPTEGRPRLPDSPQASARASVRSTWRRWAMHSGAGRPRLPGPTWKRCGASRATAAGHLALKLTRVEQRRGHYTNALRRASLGLRALGDATGPEAGAVPGCRPATRLPAQPGSLRGCPWMGGASPPEAEAADELDAQAEAHLVLYDVRCGRRTQGRAARRQRCTSSSSSATSAGRLTR